VVASSNAPRGWRVRRRGRESERHEAPGCSSSATPPAGHQRSLSLRRRRSGTNGQSVPPETVRHGAGFLPERPFCSTSVGHCRIWAKVVAGGTSGEDPTAAGRVWAEMVAGEPPAAVAGRGGAGRVTLQPQQLKQPICAARGRSDTGPGPRCTVPRFTPAPSERPRLAARIARFRPRERAETADRPPDRGDSPGNPCHISRDHAAEVKQRHHVKAKPSTVIAA
jgi:hypothetical protein